MWVCWVLLLHPSWGSDAYILCSKGQSIASCRLLSTVDLLASCLLWWGCLNVGGLETVDILFTLVQQMNRNRAGPFFAWVAVICIWERETDRKIKMVCETQTGLILLYYLGLWDLTGLDKSECVSEKEIHRTRRCTDSGLHAGTVFLSSNSMQDRKKNACLSLAVDCHQTLASRHAHRSGRWYRGGLYFLPVRLIWGQMYSDMGGVHTTVSGFSSVCLFWNLNLFTVIQLIFLSILSFWCVSWSDMCRFVWKSQQLLESVIQTQRRRE